MRAAVTAETATPAASNAAMRATAALLSSVATAVWTFRPLFVPVGAATAPGATGATTTGATGAGPTGVTPCPAGTTGAGATGAGSTPMALASHAARNALNRARSSPARASFPLS
ncbi:hypothetical protein C4K88_14720 [Arthrobacter pityocampae]|uniref:Uncharacterized protein n=1 Tax=Arthrobacter pityocampae TaxID=547334 RepID=A0A2S5IUK8_9MICC|nr:hypothetical protein C4K88_14720 [Arthrobacter pityocampae]